LVTAVAPVSIESGYLDTNPKKEPTAVKKPYQIVTRAAKESAAVVEQFCQRNGQILMSIVSLMESASQVVENVIHEIQIHVLETIFTLSAEQIAGERTPGKPSGEIRWHGSQPGKIKLAEREVKVKRPRLRHKARAKCRFRRTKNCVGIAACSSTCWAR
jgi:hypothetical protein